MEQTEKPAKAFKIITMLSDGSTTEEQREVSLKDDQGDVTATFTGLPLTMAEYRRRLRSAKYTKKVPGGNGNPPSEKTDNELAVKDFLVERLTGWRGLVGADNRAIPFTEDNKRAIVFEHLDTMTLFRIAAGLTGSEVSDFTEFRPS